MKKITILIALIVLIMAGCSNPVIYVPSDDPLNPDDIRLVGTWEYGYMSFDFTPEGDFLYYRSDTGELLNEGWYSADPDEGLLYMEDPDAGVSQLYIYLILYDEPEYGEVTLRLAPESLPENTVDWIKVLE